MTRVDYTTKRLGSRTGNGSRKIERCPACGRKGEIGRLTTSKSRLWFCTHVERAEIKRGIAWRFSVDDCSGRILDDGTLAVRPTEV